MNTDAGSRRREYEAALEEQHEWAGITQHMRLRGTNAEWVSAAAEFQHAIFWAYACYLRWQNAQRREEQGR